MLCAAGFAESPPLERMGTPFHRADLDVRWNVPSNALPSEVWVYRPVATKFSPAVISNLMVACSFSDKEKVQDNADGLAFKNSDGSRTLSISFANGRIDYVAATDYGPTNLTKGVPPMEQMPELTTNFLEKIGVDLSDIDKDEKGAPALNFSEPLTLYFINPTTITNIEWRAARFRRAVDGASFIGSNCEIDFGEYGKVSKISFPWQGMERYKKCRTADATKIISWIRNGKAVQGRLPMDGSGINWKTVKSLTVERAKLCYQSTQSFIYPIVALWTTVDTGNGNVVVEIDCPIFDEREL